MSLLKQFTYKKNKKLLLLGITFKPDCPDIRNSKVIDMINLLEEFDLDIKIFDSLRKKSWYIAPLTSSTLGSITDTFLFFSVAFYSTGVPWVTLALGDLAIKLIITLLMLIPFGLLLSKIKDYADNPISKIN